MRVAGEDHILNDIHSKLYAKFDITTSDSGRFLGMDTVYNLATGVLRMLTSNGLLSKIYKKKEPQGQNKKK
jgi:hypothetical protein